MAHPESELQRKFLVFSYFTPLVAFPLFTVLSSPLPLLTYSPKIAPTDTQMQFSTFSALSVSNWFPIATSSVPFPQWRICVLGVSGENSSLPQYHQEREERSSPCASPYLSQTWSPSKSSARRHCQLHLTGWGSESVSNLPKFTKPTNVELRLTSRSFWPQRSHYFTMLPYFLWHIGSHSKLISLALRDFLDQDPVLYNQFHISPKLHPGSSDLCLKIRCIDTH